MKPIADLEVFLCGNTSWSSNPLGAKPLALELSKSVNVVYVEPPISYLTKLNKPEVAASLKGPRLKPISSNLKVFTPLVLPGKDRRLINPITSKLLNMQLKSISKRSINTKRVCIYTAPHYKISKRSFDQLIYWMMDDYVSQPDLIGVNTSLIESGLNFAYKNSDKVVAVSSFLQAKLSKLGIKSSFIPNGASEDNFKYDTTVANESIDSKIPHDAFAIYIGGINNRIDLDCLLDCAKSGVNLVIAGARSKDVSTTKFDEIIEYSNVTFLGNVPHEDISYLLSKASVGLVPYKDSEFNKASSPLKISEYLLCGLNVVSTNVDFVNDYEKYVYTPEPTQTFADKVKELLAKPEDPQKRKSKSLEMSKSWSLSTQARKYLDLMGVTQTTIN